MEENKKLFVADASVIIKWAINEPDDLDQALMFKSDFVNEEIDIMVPTCCFPEVCNILCRQRPNMALPFFSYLVSSHIEERHVTFELVNIAHNFMKSYKTISFYDAFYHALAIRENGIFITADRKYYNKTRRRGHIMLLKNYGKKR